MFRVFTCQTSGRSCYSSSTFLKILGFEFVSVDLISPEFVLYLSFTQLTHYCHVNLY